MLLVYAEATSPRLQYILDTLVDALGTSYQLTTDVDVYTTYRGAKINYSNAQISRGEIWIEPVGLLYEQDLHPQVTKCFLWNDVKAFFKSGGNFPFDIFSASFYLLTRYEEYLPHKLDTYGRYAHENSLAFTEGFLQLPVVNVWLMAFGKLLQQNYPALSLQPVAFSFLPTYDIDIAWSYRNKGWLRNAGGMFKSVMNGEWLMVKERVNVLRGKQPDPVDIYDRLDALHDAHNLEPIYFFLLAKENKRYDKNILPSSEALQKLIAAHAVKYNVGIHPSWQSGDDETVLQTEINQLKKVTGKEVANSRQHYIRMSLPVTYQQLISAGISNDYSMGYGSINGFRASYCLSYKWYDLLGEKATGLTLHPFCYMEANSYYEQHYSLQQAAKELEHYASITQQVNGKLITIFHNHILGNKQLFTGWMEMYEGFIKRAKISV